MKNKKQKINKEQASEVIIDAEDSPVGRIAVLASKYLLKGNKVSIVNTEKARIIGSKKIILEKFLRKRRLGRGVQKGPYYSTVSYMIMKRAVRGMLPWKRTRGREAFKNLKCYEGIPLSMKNKESIKIEKKFFGMSLKEISTLIKQK